MAYLIDTIVISECRNGARANRGVRQFFGTQAVDILFLPVQVIGEIRAGIERSQSLASWTRLSNDHHTIDKQIARLRSLPT